MSTKRVRYDGPHSEILVFDPEASVYARPLATVKRGELLPQDAPARIRDELAARDNWTVVDMPAAKNDGKGDR